MKFFVRVHERTENFGGTVVFVPRIWYDKQEMLLTVSQAAEGLMMRCVFHAAGK